MNKKKIISTVIATLISLVFLWLAFRKIRLDELWNAFRQIQWLWAFPFLLVTWLSFWWRAVRWRCLLRPARDIASWRLFGPLMVGFGFNSIFPARAGEFARPLALAKQEGVPFTTGFSTVFLERVLDSLTLLGLFVLAPYFIDFGQAVVLPYDLQTVLEADEVRLYLKVLTIAAGLVAMLAVGLWYLRVRVSTANAPWMTPDRQRGLIALGLTVIALTTLGGVFLIHGQIDFRESYSFGGKGEITPEKLRRIAAGTSKLVALLFIGSIAMMFEAFRNMVLRVILAVPVVPHGLKVKVSQLFKTFATGFDSLKHPRLLVLVAIHSLGIWFLTGGSFWVMGLAVPGMEMTFTLGMAFLIITCIAILIPAAPGYWGLYEVGGVLSLILCGAVPNTPEGNAAALSYTLVVHFMQWALVTVIGLYYAGKIHVSAGEAVATAPTAA